MIKPQTAGGQWFYSSHSSLLSKYFQVYEYIDGMHGWDDQESENFMKKGSKNDLKLITVANIHVYN